MVELILKSIFSNFWKTNPEFFPRMDKKMGLPYANSPCWLRLVAASTSTRSIGP